MKQPYTKKQLEKQAKKRKATLAKNQSNSKNSKVINERKKIINYIHCGLEVNMVEWVNELPEKIGEIIEDKGITKSYVCLAYNGDSERSTPPMTKFNILKKSKCNELICHGYYNFEGTNKPIILNVSYSGQKHYLILYNPSNIRPIIIKKHISQNKYGEMIVCNPKIKIQCVPYIYDSGGNYSY